MVRSADGLGLAFDIRRPPEAVRRWWLELPDDYSASDPKEQPHRIQVLRREADRMEVLTYWRGPLGLTMKLRETLGISDPNGWTADLSEMGLHIHDEFRTSPTEEGTHLTIQSTIMPASVWGRILRPLVIRTILKSMDTTWNDAARICERDAR